MARRTKLQTFEIEVEEALEKAMNFDFNNTEIEKITSNNAESLINVDDLIQKIATSEEEILSESENEASSIASNIHDNAVVDESVVELLFGQKPIHELSGGTVRDTLLPTQPLPANDDMTVPFNFRSLKRNTVSRIYWSTTALSALWTTGGAFIAHKLAPSGLNSLANIITFITSPLGLAVAAGTTIPILMSWGFAQLIKRSNELHNIAVIMTNAAQRLSEPQNISEKQAIAISQTIRKEVAAMNEGIERTLGRAVELEAIIQSEVHNLERAYSENESRIYTLIKELNNERTAILNHADRVQTVIKGTQEQLSDEFDLATSKIATNVKQLAQTLSQTLQKQGEDLIKKLSCAGDGVTNQLFEKFNETTIQVQQKNTEFFHVLGKTFDTFAERFDNNEKQLEKTFDETIVKAEMHIAKLATHIQTATDQTLSSVDEKFRTLDEAIIDRNNQSLQDFNEKIIQLDQQAHKLSSKFDNITSEAIEAFGNRLVNVDLSLKEHSDTIIESFIARSKELENNAEKLGGFLEAHASQINVNLKEITTDIANVFTNGHDHILSAINESKKVLKEEIKNVDNAIIDIIGERSQDFKAQIADQRDVIANMLDSEKNKIADTLKDQIDVLTKNVSDVEKILNQNIQVVDQHTKDHAVDIVQCTEKLQEVITQSCEITKNALEEQAKNIDIRADALRDSLAINSFSLNEVLADQARTLEQRMETIHNLIAKSDIHIDMALKQQVDLVENAIINNNKAITETVQNHMKNLEGHTDLLKNTLSQSNDVFLDTLQTRVGLFDENLESRARQVFERAATLEETLSEKLEKVCETIDMQTSTFEERSDNLKTSIALNNEHSQAVQQALEESVSNIRISLENSVNTVTDSVQEKFINISEKLASIMANETEKSETSLVAASNQFISSFADVAVKATNIISESSNRIVSNVEQTVHETSEKVISALTEQTAHTAEAFATASNNAQTLINETVHASAEAIDQLLSERSNILHQSMLDFENNLSHQLADVSNRLEDAKNQTYATISENMEQLTELTDYLHQTAYNTTESIGNLTQQIGEQLSLSTQEAEQRIHAQNESLVNTLAQKNSETIQTMATVQEDLINNVSAVLEQLNQSIYNIHENSNILISTVQSLDGQINETANNFFHNTNQVAEYLSTSNQELNNNVETLQGLSQNTFEQISYITSNFGEHAKTLSEAIRVLEQSENTLNITLQEKQNALSVLSNALVSKSDEVNQLIKHYENVLNLIFERTDKNTRNSTDSLKQTLHELINEASTRFSEAAENIRFSANEIRLELSKINNDIDESVQKLPEKAKETTQTIRHALSEQITALKDLTSVMQNTEKEQLLPITPTLLTPNSAATEVNKKIVPPQPIAQPEQNNTKQNKWVSDLLERASREENNTSASSPEQEKSDSMNESLNSPVNGILQTINHNAAIELWNRYKRGQKNIVVEHLYTPNGKLIFETIRKKYLNDVNFKDSVNQYISDFEKLLRDISRSSGDIRLARQYLISDTGKVYTMLAHASGRIQ
ncbi:MULTISPECIES: hypothetical protein [unclassified Bartonella]|uniref:hypothetical protein n=1 Tax=unclassified Bartonella TaxID=2645622 RepID=UPI00099B1FDA|nr:MULTISPECIES: hypothetical protein [unclassified Bartonella]AQX28089.1 hypothetical protein BJB15x_006880 [Bartonella sp. JB15]AQX29362.1 hypothetical protein BJB63x_006790 [Bartonella sp. JB63]